ncbi:hypothetical protein [Gemmatimonas phototrophica]|uniref:Uncharacterized protein n=1 Tax=Gemmatimonas phototrophica TaxID=1379270 RepID=A0A143BM68_9BACT|nr:hypothetical protein [Gemmatimonas phototrophica]AMW05655.1 hypothetical protein GEMMAAP_14280 [Gemmatimonas phototrophica]
MTTADPRMLEVAQSLWALAERDAQPAGDVQSVVDRLFTRLEAGLRRWVGAEGYAALLSRSVADTLPGHPVLSTISDLGADEGMPATPQVPATVADAAVQRDAIIALMAAMMQQLGGIIGDAMAIRLIELSGTPTPRGIAGPDANDP